MIRVPLAFACLIATCFQGQQDEALLKLLPTAKVSLRDGLQQLTKGNVVPISAKFEIEDGVFQLSVYAAGKGLAAPADQNTLVEYAGDPTGAAWHPTQHVFADTEHVARSAQHLTLLAVSPCTLVDVLAKAEKEQSGTIYSITPVVHDRKPRFRLLVAEQGRSREVVYDAATREAVKGADAARK
jgi:hypothetical protein